MSPVRIEVTLLSVCRPPFLKVTKLVGGAIPNQVDAVGDVVIAGETSSVNFPITPFAYQPTIGCTIPGCDSAFITKFPLGAPGGLSITGILPSSGGNAGTVSPEITGTGFHEGATVSLSGPASIAGTSAVVGAQGQMINATLDLTTATPGVYNVVITNPDGTVATLSKAFTVQQGGAPDIRISLTGLATNHPDINSTYTITFATVSNTGSIDASGILVSEPVPTSSLQYLNPPGLAPLSQLTTGSQAIWNVPLPSTASKVFTAMTSILVGNGWICVNGRKPPQ